MSTYLSSKKIIDSLLANSKFVNLAKNLVNSDKSTPIYIETYDALYFLIYIMNNKQHRVEILPHESDMFKMNSEVAKPIIDCIKDLKKFAGLSFGEIPSYQLRIMGLGQMAHSYNNIYLQYNTQSKRYRIIIEGPSYQAPVKQELTMKSNLNRSSITKTYMVGVQNMLKYMTNDDVWEALKASYDAFQDLKASYEAASHQILSDFLERKTLLLGERAGGSRKKKSVKKQQKNILES